MDGDMDKCTRNKLGSFQGLRLPSAAAAICIGDWTREDRFTWQMPAALFLESIYALDPAQ